MSNLITNKSLKQKFVSKQFILPQINASIEDGEEESDDDDDDSDDEGAYEETSLESYTTPLDEEDTPVDEYQVLSQTTVLIKLLSVFATSWAT